ncbi:MAG: Gfo/Idh/MocA family oxidoreductase [Firmicutes bacterium]|nr:Gfo/Idh/MocA family oxidoreductase [Bacillota bacterium]
MLRVALLSQWHVHARGYAEEFRKSGKARVAAVWDEIPERGRAWADELGADFVGGLDALLDRADIDAVAVNTPTVMHEEVMVKAARAGKHIFTEKAMAPTVAECERIAAAVEKAGVTFVISMPQRASSVMQFAKQAVESGEFGTISHARFRNGHSGVSGNWLPDYWYDLGAAAGGALMDLGCHPAYCACYLFGRPVEVGGMLASPCGSQSKAGGPVGNYMFDESACAVVRFGNGVTATAETSFVTYGMPDLIEIYGSDATFYRVGDDVKYKSRKTAEFASGFIAPNLPKALDPPITQFIDACLNGTGSPAGFGPEDGINLTKVLEGAYISQREKRVVSV